MATFDPAPEKVNDLIREVIDEYYPDLVEAGARIGAVFAYPELDKDGDPKGPPLVKDGRQILARIKKNSEEDRAGGKADATITFDAELWKKLDDEPDGRRRQVALIDHELHHLIVQREKPGPNHPPSKPTRIKSDDKGRPLFKLRAHDWEITGFRAVVERHGRHAFEHEEARRFHDAYGNLLFDFASDKDARAPRPGRQESLDLSAALPEMQAVMGPDVEVTVTSARKPRGKAVAAAANR